MPVWLCPAFCHKRSWLQQPWGKGYFFNLSKRQTAVKIHPNERIWSEELGDRRLSLRTSPLTVAILITMFMDPGTHLTVLLCGRVFFFSVGRTWLLKVFTSRKETLKARTRYILAFFLPMEFLIQPLQANLLDFVSHAQCNAQQFFFIWVPHSIKFTAVWE